MDLRQLRYFVAVCETGSITRAAQALRIAQPALGLQIRKLEEELGTVLLHRHTRGVEPTEAGRVLLEEAEAILARTKLAAARVRDAEGAVQGRVVVGTTPSASAMLAGKLVQRCKERYPGVVLKLIEGMGATLIDALHRTHIDLCVTHRAGSPTGLHMEELNVEELYLVERIGESNQEPLPIAELAGRSLILSSQRHALRQLIELRAEEAGISLSVGVEVQNSSAVMCELVELGVGNTVLPYGQIKRFLAKGTLTARPFVPAITRSMYLGTPTSRPRTRAEAVVCGLIRELVREEISSGSHAWKAPPTR
ncbi:MAG TPA: LysR family transcriptional regulator [Stellaceae bacterium]|nr:LysR family transcriptional regulator [Stellaceae bacterium]